MIGEVRNGVGSTGVRPGIIGEIGSNDDTVSEAEEKSFRAAARTHLATGLTITTHAAWFPVGLQQLDILEDEGVAASRVIVGHADGVPGPDYQLALARTHMRVRGGPGYTWIIRELLPRLRDRGMSEQEVDQLLVVNPRAALTGASL